jgi:hypothetical protein
MRLRRWHYRPFLPSFNPTLIDMRWFLNLVAVATIKRQTFKHRPSQPNYTQRLFLLVTDLLPTDIRGPSSGGEASEGLSFVEATKVSYCTIYSEILLHNTVYTNLVRTSQETSPLQSPTSLWEPYGTHKYILGRMQSFIKLKQVVRAHNNRNTRLRRWLRHYPTSRKVAGSIPVEVIGFFNWTNRLSI